MKDNVLQMAIVNGAYLYVTNLWENIVFPKIFGVSPIAFGRGDF